MISTLHDLFLFHIAEISVGGASNPLCGFMRRLFLQVLLEDEKVVVTLRSASQMYKSASNALSGVVHHPRCGAGHKHRTLSVSLNTTCGEIMSRISGESADCFILNEWIGWEIYSGPALINATYCQRKKWLCKSCGFYCKGQYMHIHYYVLIY